MEKGGYGKKYRVVKHTYADKSTDWTIEWKYEGLLENVAPWLSVREPYGVIGQVRHFYTAEAAINQIDDFLKRDARKRVTGRNIENI